MRVRPRSLRAIVALYVGVILLALLGIRTINYTIVHDALNREVDRRLALEAREVTGATRTASISAMADRIGDKEESHESADLIFLLRDAAQRRVAGKLQLAPIPPPGYSDFGDTAGVDGVTHGRVLVEPVANGATLVIASDNDVVDSFDALLFWAQLVGLCATVLLFAGGAGAIVWQVSRRLRAMQRTVDAVMEGNLSSRVATDGSRNEFDRQAAAFNAMLDRIDALMANVKHAARDVAHELKSPLARLRTRMATLVRRADATPLAEDSAAILDDVDELLELFASLMRLWEIEGGQRRSQFVRVDLSRLARDVCETLSPVAEDAGDTLTVDAMLPIDVRGDLHLLRQMVVNLVENAIRHTPVGTHIGVFVRRLGGRVQIGVADTGAGIPAELHASVILRFGRLETAADRPGQGLGLTLIDAIARLHGGVLRLEDARQDGRARGLQAVVELPPHA